MTNDELLSIRIHHALNDLNAAVIKAKEDGLRVYLCANRNGQTVTVTTSREYDYEISGTTGEGADSE